MSNFKKMWKDREHNSSYVKWLFYYSKPYWWKIIIKMGLSLISTLLSLYMAVLSKQIIDNATSGAKNKALVFVALYFVLTIGMQAVSVITTLFSTMLDERFSFGIRKQIYDKIINSHWMDVTKYHTGDLMTRLTSDVTNVSDGIVWTIPEIIRLFIELVMVFFTLFYFSPLLAILALTIAPIASVTAWWLGKKLKKLQIRVQESESAYRSFLQESLANLLIVKSFANEDYVTEKLVDLREKRFFWVYKRTKFGLVSSSVMSISFQLGYIIAFAYGATQIADGIISFGTMSLFLTLVNRVQAPIMQLAQQIPKVVSVVASAGRIMELQDIPVENKRTTQIEVKNVGIHIQDLSFGYSNELVLENANLDVNPGESVAIVGKSGIGKTTLIRLIMSFMNSMSGRINFKNDKGEEIDANAGTREFLSYVPQGNTLFSGTIRENIKMGKLDATEQELLDALKIASAYEFVMELPNGIDTIIGERGHGLSEGQAQRIAIARAFVRKAPFLILDEATSSLDEKTEISVLQALQSLEPRPTCLIITHRKSILNFCDRELIISGKKIEEVQL
jgi:ABC-type multidrug transport system fused ATPase/permease subunit